jgi:phage tail-like protein
LTTTSVPKQPDQLTVARFSIVVDGVELAAFSGLEGITTEIEASVAIQSGVKQPIGATIGTPKLPMVELERGLTADMRLSAWHESARQSDPESRKSCSLVMYNVDGKPVARYHMENAWPAKIEIGALKAGATEVLMERATFVCEELRRVDP